MHISTVNISHTVTTRANIAIVNTESRMCPFDWCIYIWRSSILKVRVKIIHNSIDNILQMVTDRANIIIIIIIIIIIVTIIIINIILFKVKNINLKSNLEWLTFGVIPIDEGASESNLIETLY